MSNYEQINLKLKPDEKAMWDKHAEKARSMTQFIRNCVQRAIAGDTGNDVPEHLERTIQDQTNQLKAIINNQRQQIELLTNIIEVVSEQSILKESMKRIAGDTTDQDLMEAVFTAIDERGPITLKAIAKEVDRGEVDVHKSLQLLEDMGKIKVDYLRKPYKYEVHER
jgi:hypothetical protein